MADRIQRGIYKALFKGACQRRAAGGKRRIDYWLVVCGNYWPVAVASGW